MRQGWYTYAVWTIYKVQDLYLIRKQYILLLDLSIWTLINSSCRSGNEYIITISR